MRVSRPSHSDTTWRPMKLRVARPVMKMISSVRMVPRPGIWKPTSASGRQLSGSSSSDWSMVPMIRLSTHTVMASGTRISRPVMKYLRMGWFFAYVALGVLGALGAAAAGAAGAAAAGAAAAPASEDGGASAAGSAVPVAPVLLATLLLLPRKSVTYQPEPLSWKPAAVSCFLKLSLLQDGQTVNASSDIFCSTSLAKPHASQRYA